MVSYAKKLISEHGVSEFGHMACPNSDFFFFFFFFFARVADEFSEVARDARVTRILHWREEWLHTYTYMYIIISFRDRGSSFLHILIKNFSNCYFGNG